MSIPNNPLTSRIDALNAPSINKLLTTVVTDWNGVVAGKTEPTFFDRTTEGSVLVSIWGESEAGVSDFNMADDTVHVKLWRSIDGGQTYFPIWETKKNVEVSIKIDSQNALYIFTLASKHTYHGVRVRARS